MYVEPLKRFSPLVYSYTDDGRWKLEKPLFYFQAKRDPVVVPAKFITDMDSVPRVPVVYAAYKGRAVRSAVVHDYLYFIGADKALADRTFLNAMRDEGIHARWRYPIYWAVVIFGGFSYRKRSPEGA